MTFDNLPTDNLYKFVIVLGIAVFSLGLWLENDTDTKLARAYYQNDSQLRLIEVRQATVQADLDFFTDENGNLSDAKILENPVRAKELIANHIKSQEEYERLRTGGYTDYLVENYLASNKKSSITFAKFGGLALSFVGFVSWWFLHQRHQDSIVRTQARNARRESGTAES